MPTSSFGTLPDGREATLFTLRNKVGTVVKLSNYGALLVSIETADRDGNVENITLSYKDAEEAGRGGVFGSVIGRYANRISGGGFTIDGIPYALDSVNAKTGVHIHGGSTGFHRQLWDVESAEDNKVIFTITSPDGHEGYPGKVEASVRYMLHDNNFLQLAYKGKTSKPTHLNMTNHVYFNLAGSGTVEDHRLWLSCDNVLEVDENKIPTGKRIPVKDTLFDFTPLRIDPPVYASVARVGDHIGEIEGGGYDHCFTVRGYKPRLQQLIARLEDPDSGRSLKIRTTMPGVQIYTANHLKDNPFPRWGGICFETQFFPDTPNRPEFPSSLLRPGQTYYHLTQFEFGIMKEKP